MKYIPCPRCRQDMELLGGDRKKRIWFRCRLHGYYTVNTDELRAAVEAQKKRKVPDASV